MDFEFFNGGIALIFCFLGVGWIPHNLHPIKFLRPKVGIITGIDSNLQQGRGLAIIEICARAWIGIAAEVVPTLSVVVVNQVANSACTVRIGLGSVEIDVLDTVAII